MRLSGRALGLALGVMLALQLVLSTTWLVVRGTAGESRHAALLSNYLPGYSVSIPGSLIGGGWLFLYAFVASLLLAKVYNTIVDRRAARGTRHD
jgi:ABC-type Fe3+ transport system permease subunit